MLNVSIITQSQPSEIDTAMGSKGIPYNYGATHDSTVHFGTLGNSRPPRPHHKNSIVLSATKFIIFKENTKVGALGRHQKRGGVTWGCAASFVLPFVVR